MRNRLDNRGSAGALRQAPDTATGVASVAACTLAIGWWLSAGAGWRPELVLTGLAAFGVLSLIVTLLARLHLSRMVFGVANQVTLFRAGLVCLSGSALLASGGGSVPAWSLLALVAPALLLDGLDGYLARRLGLVSDFGARFDVEVDALLLLILALLCWQTGQVGPWVLAIGLLRYVFVALGWVLPWLRGTLSPSLRRKAICAVQGVVLLVGLLPVVPPALAALLAAGALTALIGSFAIDILALARTPAQRPA